MKTVIKKLFVIMSVMLVAVIFAGCGAGMYGSWIPSGIAPGDSMSGEIAPVSPDGDGSGGNGSQTSYVKQLTGAEWRDATNYEFWLDLFKKDVVVDGQQDGEQITRNGIFYEYAKATRGLDTFDMHEVTVTYNGDPVVGAQVKLYDANDAAVYSAVSDSTGTAYVFGDGTLVEATSGQYSVSASVAVDGATNIELNGSEQYSDEIEIMFVVDTTGSMGDELSFLCDELAGVVTRVADAVNCDIRMGLLFYRDEGDEYLTKKFDFVEVTTSAGLNTVVSNINKQRSAGGGDYPEAVDTALSQAVEMSWHTNSKTKLLFHVLDAPYHDEQVNQGRFAQAVKTAAQKGIRIIPVAASGLDTLGQFTMRSAALLTGGTYTFLTDDSGIGNSHELPAVGQFTVEYLSDLMVRLIKGYYTGTFDAPVYWKQSGSVI